MARNVIPPKSSQKNFGISTFWGSFQCVLSVLWRWFHAVTVHLRGEQRTVHSQRFCLSSEMCCARVFFYLWEKYFRQWWCCCFVHVLTRPFGVWMQTGSALSLLCNSWGTLQVGGNLQKMPLVPASWPERHSEILSEKIPVSICLLTLRQ